MNRLSRVLSIRCWPGSAGSAGSIGIRSAVPTVAAQLDAGAGSLTAATRQALLPSTGAPIFRAIDGGYRVLLDELVRRSGLRWVQAAIALIERDGAGWVLRDDSGAHWHADGVIVAVPAPQVARLIGDIAPPDCRGGRPGFGGFGGGAGAQGSQCDAISGSVGSVGGHRRKSARQSHHAVQSEMGREG